MKRTIALLGALLLLGGCPLPQNLAEISTSSSVTPPRIVNELTVRSATDSTFGTADLVVAFDPTCSSISSNQPFTGQVKVADESNVDEVIDYRWFVDYPADPNTGSYFPIDSGSIQPLPSTASNRVIRDVPSPAFPPAAFGNQVHVLELVVSNGFDNLTPEAQQVRPYRTPATNFEVQTYRWVFEPFDGSAGSTSPACPSVP